MKYSLILWDFDGTLADTLRQGLHIYNDLAARYGYAPIADAEAVRELTPREFLKTHGIPVFRVPRLMREFLAAQSANMHATPLFPRLEDVLAALTDAQRVQGVVSSNNEPNIRTCLRANAVDEHFEFVVGYSRLFGKRHALRRVLDSRGVEPRDVLYVGDEVRDVEAARRTGVDVAAVTWGFNSKRVLATQGPTYVVDAPADILELALN